PGSRSSPTTASSPLPSLPPTTKTTPTVAAVPVAVTDADADGRRRRRRRHRHRLLRRHRLRRPNSAHRRPPALTISDGGFFPCAAVAGDRGGGHGGDRGT